MNNKPFEYHSPTHIQYGAGILNTLPVLLNEQGISAPLLVCDAGIIDAGLASRVAQILDKAGTHYVQFSDIHSDPEVRSVREGIKAAKAAECDGVIGLGGGSVLDVAKAIGSMLTNEGDIRDYFGVDRMAKNAAPVICIPTTAGTGSEVTVWSVLSDTENNAKVNIGSYRNCARVALLDPELSLGLPAHITAATGMDALTHAIESYVNKACHALAAGLAEKSIALIADNLRLAVLQGDNIHARGNMLIASSLAGMAFNRIRLGLAHAFALPLGNHFHIPHGLVNAIMLTPVMKFNVPANLEGYATIARLFGENTAGLSLREAAERSVVAVQQLKRDIGLTQTLADFGLGEDRFDEVIDEALTSGNVPVNPRMPSRDDMRRLLWQGMTGEA